MKTVQLTVVFGALTLSGAALACGQEATEPPAAMARAERPAQGEAEQPDSRWQAGQPGGAAEGGARVARTEKGPHGGRARPAGKRGA